MVNRTICFSLLLLGTTTLISCSKNAGSTPSPAPPPPTTINWGKAADSSSQSLVNNFFNSQGNYFNSQNSGNDYTRFQYWPQAHALDVMIDAYNRTKSQFCLDIINKWYNGVYTKNGNTFLGYYYDDEGWNALAVLRAYDATNNIQWKNAAEDIWADIKTGWNSTMGGGIAWNHGQLGYKNTPANGPACILAARLYEQFHDPDDSIWAFKIYDWLKSTLYVPGTGEVYDGINGKGDGTIDTWKYTYNQGLFVGAAVELYKITGNPTYLNDANKAASYAINVDINTTDRLLQVEGGGDGGLFKGVFVRYFTQLILSPGLESGTKANYLNFLKNNAQILWTVGTNKTGGVFYGSYWKTPPQTGSSVDLTVELSGCMLIEAMNMVQ
ncbi:MAG: alpha-1,6-mannanase [Chitinophagaceae bacterium]|nr:alpha-1,6-mannanase [Chitinophagaceae bacterium]